VTRWQYGPVLVTYGAFSIRERWLLVEGVQQLRAGEILLEQDPTALLLEETEAIISVAPISLRTTDLAIVVRWARIYVNGRRSTLAIHRRDLDLEQQSADAEEDEDNIAELAAWVAEFERTTELVAQALQELEAAHPELDLEPFEETIDPDPEFTATILQIPDDDDDDDDATHQRE